MRHASGFTLNELIVAVVAAVIVILAMVATVCCKSSDKAPTNTAASGPANNSAEAAAALELARRDQCLANLKKISKALEMYRTATEGHYPLSPGKDGVTTVLKKIMAAPSSASKPASVPSSHGS